VPVLKVDLQEGFSGETIVLRINGEEAYRGTPRTRTQIGLADTRSFELPGRQHTLEVEIPGSGVAKSLILELNQDLYVGVTLREGGEISSRISLEPFGYL